MALSASTGREALSAADIQKSYIYIRIYIELYLQASRKGFPEPGSEALGGGGVCLRP